MKIKTIDFWNNLEKDEATDIKAIEGDTVVLINGIVFLIQRKNDWNNIVCWRIYKSKINIVQTFEQFRAFCQTQGIDYIRVEGIGKHQYKILNLVLRHAPETTRIVYAKDESEEYNRHIWYVKVY